MSGGGENDPGIGDSVMRELGLKNGLVEAFLSHSGDAVFPAMAELVGREFAPGRCVVAWAESWGRYAIAVQGRAGKTLLDSDAWARLPGDGGWHGASIRVEMLETAEGTLYDIDAVPIREKDSVVGFVGLSSREGATPPDAGSAVPSVPGGAPGILRGAVAFVQAFAVERIHETRLESMRKMTATALARSERRFQDFIEGSRDMIYIADASGVIVLVNRAGEEILGRLRSEILGRPFGEFCSFPADMECYLERLRNEGFVRDFEMTLSRPDSSNVLVAKSATAVRDAAGGIVEVHCIVHDITEWLESQRELWKANLELAETNGALKSAQLVMVRQEKLASIGQLAAGIAHEINNPLGFLMSGFRSFRKAATSMAAFIAEARDSGDAALAAELTSRGIAFHLAELPGMVTEMEDGFGRIAEIVRNLLTFSRSGENDSRAPYEVNAGIERSLVMARNEIRYVADLELRLGEVPPVPANAGEIDRVFLNLLVNAGQAIASQGRKDRGRIEVSSFLDGASVVVVIADDGPGIPEESVGRIFEPFFTTKEPGKGTGLGLSISWDIVVRKHGGSLSFGKSERGGTAFRIVLPAGPPGEGIPDGRS